MSTDAVRSSATRFDSIVSRIATFPRLASTVCNLHETRCAYYTGAASIGIASRLQLLSSNTIVFDAIRIVSGRCMDIGRNTKRVAKFGMESSAL